MSTRAAALSVLLLALARAGAVASAATPPDEEPPEVRYAAMLEREYGPLGTTTAQILGRESTHEAVTVVGALVYRIRAKPPERRSVIEQRLVAARDLLDEVTAGGFQQYFASAAADQVTVALQAFRDMGAAELARQTQRAMSVFPQGRPPADLERRSRMLPQIQRRAQGVWGGCEDVLYLRVEGFPALALEYAKRHRARIVLP